MSVFSDMLKNFIHEKDVKVGALAHYCNLERSTIYKFINGKREPASVELVEQIASFLRLTPTEALHLQEAWEIVHMGETTYYSRKSVARFFSEFPSKSFSHISQSFSPLSSEVASAATSKQDSMLLSSRQAIDSSIHQILLREASKTTGQIGIFLQPDYSFLFHLLSTIHPAGSLNIQHIFSLNHTLQFTEDHELCEFHYLRNLLPIYMNGLDYHPYCFYTNEDSHFRTLTIMPYMILTTDFAITCTSDFQMGILYRNPDVLHALWNLFFSHRDHCLTLFKPISISPDKPHDVFHFLSDSCLNHDNMIGIQPEPCLTPFFEKNLLVEIFNHDLPQSDTILTAAQSMFEKNMQKIRKGNFLLYFTEYGLVHFQQTGKLAEIPDDFYHPLTIPQRVELLQKVAQCCHLGIYRILKKPLNYLPQNLHLCLRGAKGFLTFQSNQSETICLSICDPSLLQIFLDFLENMEETLYYTPGEAEQIVSRLIQQMQ